MGVQGVVKTRACPLQPFVSVYPTGTLHQTTTKGSKYLRWALSPDGTQFAHIGRTGDVLDEPGTWDVYNQFTSRIYLSEVIVENAETGMCESRPGLDQDVP